MSRDSEVHSSVDSWTAQDAPGRHHARTSRLWLCGDNAASKRRYTFIHLHRPFPLNANVISATLHLHAKDNWTGGAHTVNVERVTAQWGEKRINWNNQPTVGGTAVTKSVTANARDPIDIDVTAIYNAVTVGGTYHGLRLRLNDGDTGKVNIYASEAANHQMRPWLEVLWSEKPEPPRNGVPRDGAAISLGQPTINYMFGVRGRDPHQQQNAKQLQISTSTSFASPVYDSGKVIDDQTQFSLAGTAFTATVAATYYYRIRAWDADDVVSDYSDTWSFTRQNDGVLTIVNPAASPSNIVKDLTPPISWTFTGQTQSHYELTLFQQRADGSWKRLWQLARHKSTEVSHNIPAGYIRSNKTFMVRLRVWDSINRMSVPGDPKYVEASRTFTYTRDGTPANVTALVGVVDRGGIKLTWNDSAQPDYYCIRVNGDEVIQRLEPMDVFVSGTSYQYTYWRGEHNVPQTIAVERVINSAGNLFHSSGATTVTVTPNIQGKWLVDDDPDGGQIAVQVIGGEQSDFAIGETGETFNPLHSQKPVRIIDSIRGYEGGIGGILNGGTAYDNFLLLKGVNRKLRYLAQHLNIPVRMGEVGSLAPLADAHTFEGWQLEVELFQVGEFFDVIGVEEGHDDD